MELRKATVADIDRIMTILDDARAFQRSMGFRQWEDGYPDRPTILADISTGNARVLIDTHENETDTSRNSPRTEIPDKAPEILGYCLLAVGDAAYDQLDHTWLCQGPYGVIHRFALATEARGKKLATRFLDLIEQEYIRRRVLSLRVDTGAANLIMRHLLLTRSYHPHGLLTFIWGPRLTFEKPLLPPP